MNVSRITLQPDYDGLAVIARQHMTSNFAELRMLSNLNIAGPTNAFL
ncbi:hypothetical protein TBK1r_02870 [Stieleria magnilauensis]|uniref:Uncharacterized protein n=1 Tax=Stieleria magnilauensis TaxID=2527963 RepID=A0ABX5XHU7_9BACT|nr:hypothetical protein TBK1r_02870 [Planctomycetes bacterium TBK1r]